MTAPQPATPGSDSVREELAEARCPACRKPYRTTAGYDRHIATHRDENGKPRCNCLLPVEAMGYSHQLACPVTWMPRAAAYRTNPSEETDRGE